MCKERHHEARHLRINLPNSSRVKEFKNFPSLLSRYVQTQKDVNWLGFFNSYSKMEGNHKQLVFPFLVILLVSPVFAIGMYYSFNCTQLIVSISKTTAHHLWKTSCHSWKMSSSFGKKLWNFDYIWATKKIWRDDKTRFSSVVCGLLNQFWRPFSSSLLCEFVSIFTYSIFLIIPDVPPGKISEFFCTC